VPAASEIANALGATHILIGRTDEDSGQFIRHLPSVGRVLNPSVERIIGLAPDLVIAWADAAELIRRLQTAGIATYAARFERLDASTSNLQRIGVLVGKPARADSLAAAIRTALHAVRMRSAGQDTPTVLYVLDSEPLWTAGPNTFVDDVIRLAGGRNVFADLPTKWTEVSLEAVIARQPEVIIVAQPQSLTTSVPWLRTAPWRTLDAVRNNRVHVVDSDQFNRPGPNVAATARELAHLLHPEH
jgi:iron complex transport system substrate-binding protein